MCCNGAISRGGQTVPPNREGRRGIRNVPPPSSRDASCEFFRERVTHTPFLGRTVTAFFCTFLHVQKKCRPLFRNPTKFAAQLRLFTPRVVQYFSRASSYTCESRYAVCGGGCIKRPYELYGTESRRKSKIAKSEIACCCCLNCASRKHGGEQRSKKRKTFL